ncbi:MAG: hypothetical protein R2861_04530 [Desulfobacterales bacterium]
MKETAGLGSWRTGAAGLALAFLACCKEFIRQHRDFAEQAIRFFREHRMHPAPGRYRGMPDMLAAILMKLAETEPQTGKKETFP